MRCPLTVVPFVEPRSTTLSWTSASLALHPELDMAAGDTPGSSMRSPALLPRPTTRPGASMGCLCAADVEEHRSVPDRRVAGVGVAAGRGRHSRCRRAAHPEPAGGEVVRAVEVQLEWPGENVALLGGVRMHHRGQFADQGLPVGRELLVVGPGQVDREVVGRQPAVPAQDLRRVVHLTLQGGGDLHRLHRASEGPGEHTCHHVLEPLFEPVQSTHFSTSLAAVSAGGPRGPRLAV